ncbi:c-type cytochrome [Haloferula rosea]|uniref:Cytochrome c n=1 Tax=Haloferula rosea TaxID=490093 RepID=A0A934RBL2_9BACT|nr:cytochrome c [Haloferula rosea]MBK1826314.1 cytochrome c [Haloferula rosea]
MKYFFLAYAIIAALVIGLLPMRGDKTAKTPIRLFPDMDDQDKVMHQVPSDFFADGVGSREPVDGTQPVGFLADGDNKLGGIHEYEFGGETGYYYTGGIEGYFSNGMPGELELNEENVEAFLRRGEEVYDINCMPCHGASGDGLGITTSFGVPGVANLTLDNFGQAAYPDGRLYDVIANGKGNMGGYKHNISVRDRWAVVAYVRALQIARKAPLADPKVKAAYEASQAAN